MSEAYTPMPVLFLTEFNCILVGQQPSYVFPITPTHRDSAIAIQGVDTGHLRHVAPLRRAVAGDSRDNARDVGGDARKSCGRIAIPGPGLG